MSSAPRYYGVRLGWWADDANCIGEDPKIFNNNKRTAQASQTAQSICNACPVALSCLRHAVANGEPDIWAGTTEAQRKNRKYVQFLTEEFARAKKR